MTAYIFLALIGVLLAFALLYLIMRRWGPGIAERSLDCPVARVPAAVRFVQQEGSFGSLKTTDVQACSLFPDAPVTCGKECLPHSL